MVHAGIHSRTHKCPQGGTHTKIHTSSYGARKDKSNPYHLPLWIISLSPKHKEKRGQISFSLLTNINYCVMNSEVKAHLLRRVSSLRLSPLTKCKTASVKTERENRGARHERERRDCLERTGEMRKLS